jgi:hypothetical protein
MFYVMGLKSKALKSNFIILYLLTDSEKLRYVLAVDKHFAFKFKRFL